MEVPQYNLMLLLSVSRTTPSCLYVCLYRTSQTSPSELQVNLYVCLYVCIVRHLIETKQTLRSFYEVVQLKQKLTPFALLK